MDCPFHREMGKGSYALISELNERAVSSHGAIPTIRYNQGAPYDVNAFRYISAI